MKSKREEELEDLLEILSEAAGANTLFNPQTIDRLVDVITEDLEVERAS
jgi:hypothetical protein